jgi:hypothetical protein
MSIIDWAREGGISGFDIECDKCSYSENFDEEDFRTMIKLAKRHGWISKRASNGDWIHICQTCAEEKQEE